MSFVTNFLAPLIQWLVYLGLGVWIIFIIYKGTKKAFPNFILFMKFKVFRGKWDESKVDWCMKAYDSGWNEVEITKFLLLHHYSNKYINEMMYYFENIVKTIEKNGTNIRPNNIKLKEIPSIENENMLKLIKREVVK
jgi:hypothetical protein